MMKEIDLSRDSWKRQVIGSTFDKRLKQALYESQQRVYREQLSRFEHIGIHETAIVAALDRRRRVKDIGLNVPSDLILDNFGTWLAGFIRQPVKDDSSVYLHNLSDASKRVLVYSDLNLSDRCFSYPGSYALGTNLQLGESDNAPGRGDYAITDAFATSPESGRFGTGPGSYTDGTGVISFNGAITAGGSGTIKEAGFFVYWQDYDKASLEALMFHDLISPTVAFVASDILTCAYTITL